MAATKAQDDAPRKKTLLTKVVPGLLRTLVHLVFPAQIAAPFFLTDDGLGFYLAHLTYPLAAVVVAITCAAYALNNHQRVHPPKDKRGKQRRAPLPPRNSLSTVIRDVVDVIANLDTIPWRVFYLVGFVVTIIITLGRPVSVDDIVALTQGGSVSGELIVSALTPLLYAAICLFHLGNITKRRNAWIEQVYAIANAFLKYKPLPQRGVASKRHRITATPHLAVEVRKWRNLTEGDQLFVWAPEHLSTNDQDAWSEFEANLTEQMPRNEEWRIVTTGQRGKGALVTPANYPRQVVWDGTFDPTDPLAFDLGVDLEDGDTYSLTLEGSPHGAISGPTETGKTSAAEILAAQVLVRPMPWDLTLYGQLHILDPKGPFAKRWIGRPGVICSNGQDNSQVEPYVYDEEGNVACEKTGVFVMADHLQYIEEEHKRRATILGQYQNAATWAALPPEVLKAEKFFPMLVVMDEFLDHTMKAKGADVRTKLENENREFIVSMADWHMRKARNVGIHYILIGQRANMKLFGDTLMTNAPLRLVTGQMDLSQLRSMFELDNGQSVPSLPSTYVNGAGKVKTVRGRARVRNSGGQAIKKIQVMYFGGDENADTLDKWLPRGERPKNGEFRLPEGTRPRKASDFDEEGNFIGEPDAAAITTPVDGDGNPTGAPQVPADVTESPEEAKEATVGEDPQEAETYEEDPDAGIDTDDEDDPAPDDGEATEAPTPPTPPAKPAQAEDDAAPPEGEVPPDDAEEDAPIFPAQKSADSCASCDSDPSWTCQQCGDRYCADHGNRTRNPDPAAQARFLCADCADRSPLKAVGLSVLLPETLTKTTRYKLHLDYGVNDSEDGPYGQLTIRVSEGGPKIVVVTSRPNGDDFAYQAQSSSGTVNGLAAAEDRIDVSISTYVRKRQEALAATSGEDPR